MKSFIKGLKAGNIARLILGLVYLIIFLISGSNYLEYKTVIETDKPVEYTVVKTYYTSGRGRSYHMDATFQNRAYRLDITQRIADNIEENIYPDLYYVKTKDKLITNWHITRSRRILIFSFSFLILCMIPFGKIIEKVKNNKPGLKRSESA